MQSYTRRAKSKKIALTSHELRGLFSRNLHELFNEHTNILLKISINYSINISPRASPMGYRVISSSIFTRSSARRESCSRSPLPSSPSSSFARSRTKKAGPWKEREIIGIPNRPDYVLAIRLRSLLVSSGKSERL